MVGKKAWEYIQKNKIIIDKVILVDVEYGELKCIYEYNIEELEKKDFKFDDGTWQYENEEAYTLLYGVSFKHNHNVEIVHVTKSWFISL